MIVPPVEIILVPRGTNCYFKFYMKLMFYRQQILDNGAVARDGRLKAGQRILEVNILYFTVSWGFVIIYLSNEHSTDAKYNEKNNGNLKTTCNLKYNMANELWPYSLLTVATE